MKRVIVFHIHFQTINHRVSEWVRYFAARSDVERVTVYYSYSNLEFRRRGLVVPNDLGLTSHPKVDWREVTPDGIDFSRSRAYRFGEKIRRMYAFSRTLKGVRHYFFERQQSVVKSIVMLMGFPILYPIGNLMKALPFTNTVLTVFELSVRYRLMFQHALRAEPEALRPGDVALVTNIWTLCLGRILRRLQPDLICFYDPMEVVFDMWGGLFSGIAQARTRFLLKIYEGYHIRFFDFFVGVSEPMTKLYASTYRRAGRGLTLPNAFAFEELAPNLNTGTHIRFVAQLTYSSERGLPELVEAFRLAACENASLVLRILGCPEELLETFSKVPGVVIEPAIEGEDNLTPALLGFDVGVIPYLPDTSLNHRVCCPNKAFQYMTAGLALLSTNTEFLSTLIERENIGYLYDPSDIPSAAAVFREICRKPSSLGEKRSRAHQFARETFNNSIWKEELDAAQI